MLLAVSMKNNVCFTRTTIKKAGQRFGRRRKGGRRRGRTYNDSVKLSFIAFEHRQEIPLSQAQIRLSRNYIRKLDRAE